ncbi:PqqD family protein [bacterium]|nr:PqqD family protein [bacterium]
MKRYKRKENIVSRKENNGVVLFNTSTGEPFYIEGAAIEIWDIIENENDISTIKKILSKKYEETQAMESDIMSFLNECDNEGLINVL